MHVTEMLIAGYDEDKSMFAVSLVDGHASVILTHTDGGGETVRSAWRQAVDSFDEVRDLVERIVDAPAHVST
jgi:hypothetical protein